MTTGLSPSHLPSPACAWRSLERRSTGISSLRNMSGAVLPYEDVPDPAAGTPLPLRVEPVQVAARHPNRPIELAGLVSQPTAVRGPAPRSHDDDQIDAKNDQQRSTRLVSSRSRSDEVPAHVASDYPADDRTGALAWPADPTRSAPARGP